MIGVNFSPKQPRGLKAIDPSRLDFNREEMTLLAGEAIRVLNDQVSKGLGAKGYPMKPLSNSYRNKKIAKGQPGIRNLQFSGAMLRSLAPADVQINHAFIGFSNESQNAKAVANEIRSKWFGLDSSNDQLVHNLAERMIVNKTR